MTKRVVHLVIMICVLQGTLFAARMGLGEANTLFREGNAAYRVQNFTAAYENYKKVADGGISSPELWYNLGNAAARLGKTGEAVLYYERARQLAPRDADLKFNIRKVAPAGNESRTFVLFVPFNWLLNLLSLREWMAIFLALFILWGVVGGLFAISQRKGSLRILLGIVSALLLVVASFTAVRFYNVEFVQDSIVMQGDSPVFSGPGEGFTQLGRLPEGTRVRHGGFNDPKWVQVRLPDGREGFMKSELLHPI